MADAASELARIRAEIAKTEAEIRRLSTVAPAGRPAPVPGGAIPAVYTGPPPESYAPPAGMSPLMIVATLGGLGLVGYLVFKKKRGSRRTSWSG